MGHTSSMIMDSLTADQTVEPSVQEDFDCPICHEILRMPIRTRNCHHVFCKSCFQSAVGTLGPHCPLCRGPVSEREQRATDIQQKMRQNKGQCRACGAEKFFSKMRLHYRSCRKYKEEYGPVADVPLLAPVQAPTPPSNREIRLIIPIYPSVTPPSSGDRAYSCPYCPLAGLSDMALVQHCVSQHRTERTPAVCPICMHMPWGNANYCSRNLIGHMLRRHRFSYSEYMNEEEDEDFQLCQALQVSAQEL